MRTPLAQARPRQAYVVRVVAVRFVHAARGRARFTDLCMRNTRSWAAGAHQTEALAARRIEGLVGVAIVTHAGRAPEHERALTSRKPRLVPRVEQGEWSAHHARGRRFSIELVAASVDTEVERAAALRPRAFVDAVAVARRLFAARQPGGARGVA